MTETEKQNAGRFPKGRSGNPKGRPARRRVPQDPIFNVLSETIRVNGPGGPRDMLPEEMVEWATFLAALKGKARAIRDMTEWMIEYRTGLAKDAFKPVPIQQVTQHNPENANEALQLLGIAAPNPGPLRCLPFLLTPWSVQAALS